MSKIGHLSLDFAFWVVEKLTTINVTTANVTENFNLNLVPKDQIITSTSLAVSSKILQSNGVGLIAGPTPNLLI